MRLLQEVRDQQSTGASKPPAFCKKTWNEEGVCQFAFNDGTNLEFDTRKVNDETRLDLTCHGANQKIGDSFAGVKGNTKQGISNAQAVIDQLYAGEWTSDREGGAPRLAELAAAIARIRNAPLEKVTAAVEKASDDQRKQWRSNAQVKAMIAKIRAEKAAEVASGQETQELTIDLG